MPTQSDAAIYDVIRDQTLAVLGDVLKNVHENGIAAVRYFGVRSDADRFSLSDLRYAVAFYRTQLARLPPPGIGNQLPPREEAAFQSVCEELMTQGMLLPVFADFEHREFRVRLVPPPFDRDWQFMRQLSGGGQSRTLQVRHRTKGTEGVLKLLAVPTSSEETTAAITRFQREVAELEKIDHPAVVCLISRNVDRSQGELGYVTRLGVPLEIYWDQLAKTLTAGELYDRAYELIRDIANGLTAVHRLGLVHRDLKPDNIIIQGEQPAIIDFGLVATAKYEKDNLTEVDGRQVANHFNPPAVHGLNDDDPRRDVASLGWLYGFLLGKPVGGKRRPQRFHWQFHQLIEEARQDRARSVLAVCSLCASIPPTAADFIALMDRLSLDGNSRQPGTVGAPELQKIEEIHAESVAREIALSATENESVELAISLFAEPLTLLRKKIVELCRGTERLPIVQWGRSQYEPDDAFLTQPSPGSPFDSLMRQAHRQVSNAPDTTQSELTFFHCHCGQTRKFRVAVKLVFNRHFRPGALNYVLSIESVDQFGARTRWHDSVYSMGNDGQFRNTEDDKVATVLDIAGRVQQLCYQPAHWQQL